MVRAQGKFTEEQLKARFYYDLGPDSVDVSSYPKEQQANYAVFAKTCAQCHTLARPIHAPIIERKDWKRYVDRMHVKATIKSDVKMTKADSKAVLEFLAYDSKVRKMDRRAEFEFKTNELKALFKKVETERSKRQIEEGRKKSRQGSPYVGDRP
ncbi:MAG: hypothetical protein HY400_02500 [Elusimicrobia bacterium]|nr:hypothetical protein [Elusimicrobiota bacterium]